MNEPNDLHERRGTGHGRTLDSPCDIEAIKEIVPHKTFARIQALIRTGVGRGDPSTVSPSDFSDIQSRMVREVGEPSDFEGLEANPHVRRATDSEITQFAASERLLRVDPHSGPQRYIDLVGLRVGDGIVPVAIMLPEIPEDHSIPLPDILHMYTHIVHAEGDDPDDHEIVTDGGQPVADESPECLTCGTQPAFDTPEHGLPYCADCVEDLIEEQTDLYDDVTVGEKTGGTVSKAAAAQPLAQIHGIDVDEMRAEHLARGERIISTEKARSKLHDTFTKAIREEDTAVLRSPTGLGKSYTAATYSYELRDDVTDGRQAVHLSKTRDARDEAIEAARQDGGEFQALYAAPELCDCYDDEYTDWEVDDTPLPEWFHHHANELGLSNSLVHLIADQKLDHDLPCQTNGECPSIQQFERLREEEPPLVFATHNFAHVPRLRAEKNVILDEQPDYQTDIDGDRLRVDAEKFLSKVDAPVTSWNQFVGVATTDTFGDDAFKVRERLRYQLQDRPDHEWFFENNVHALVPAICRAIATGESRANGRYVGKTAYSPPRPDENAHDSAEWNRSWVTAVLNEHTGEIEALWSAPDFSGARSVVGLDAHPSMINWEVNVHPEIHTVHALRPEQRQNWRLFERGLRVVQCGSATRPLTKLSRADRQGDQTLVDAINDETEGYLRTGITTAQYEPELGDVLDESSPLPAETMHYGEEKSRNDFADEEVGYVVGCMDPGDDYVLNLLAARDLNASPGASEQPCGVCGDPDSDEGGNGCNECNGTGYKRERGRTWTGPDARRAEEALASVRESHVAQAAGRYARNPDDPDDTATVYVRTDAIPDELVDLVVPDVVWTYGDTQQEIVRVLQRATEPLSAREIAERADCSKQHAHETLKRIADATDGVQAFLGDGKYGADLFTDTGTANSGAALWDGEIVNSAVLEYTTWALAIRPSGFYAAEAEEDESGPTPETSDGDNWGGLTVDERVEPGG
jgi:hypothetical protein